MAEKEAVKNEQFTYEHLLEEYQLTHRIFLVDRFTDFEQRRVDLNVFSSIREFADVLLELIDEDKWLNSPTHFLSTNFVSAIHSEPERKYYQLKIGNKRTVANTGYVHGAPKYQDFIFFSGWRNSAAKNAWKENLAREANQNSVGSKQYVICNFSDRDGSYFRFVLFRDGYLYLLSFQGYIYLKAVRPIFEGNPKEVAVNLALAINGIADFPDFTPYK